MGVRRAKSLKCEKSPVKAGGGRFLIGALERLSKAFSTEPRVPCGRECRACAEMVRYTCAPLFGGESQ